MDKGSTYSLGIDIGTGSIKAVIINNKGLVINSYQQFYPIKSGFVMLDPEMIWTTFKRCLNEVLFNLEGKNAGVTLSSCMHSLLLMDKNNKPLTPLITWADTRSNLIANRLRNSPIAKKIYLETGAPIHAMTPFCKIIWYKENEPALFKKVFKFISIKEFIWFQLFKVYQVDHSIAGSSGLFNIKSLDWNQLSIKTSGIKSNQLSEIVGCDHFRTVTDKGKFNGITFCIGSSDGCFANLGSFVFNSKQVALTIGTSGAVRTTLTKPNHDFKNMVFNYVLDKSTFISGGPINNGGNIVKWLLKTYLKIEDPNENDYTSLFLKIKTIPPGSEGLLFLPYLNGERAPVWDENASGAFVGIKNHHNENHFLRAGVEGVCFALHSILEMMEKEKSFFSSIHISGGFIQNKEWVQMLADITVKKILIFYDEDASALGAAFYGLSTFKIIKDFTKIKVTPKSITSPNQRNYKIYKKYFSIYKKIYPSIKDISHQLQ